MAESNVEGRSLNFLEEIVEEDLEARKIQDYSHPVST